ncbi:MAG: TlpA family protein disulfide reductase [Acidobacteriia bacterium]|jgi:thiol-disulfide isomerase/thioredoxin|nr:TlpA family protein disulfide reductase [Terriglobia bacterium]
MAVFRREFTVGMAAPLALTAALLGLLLMGYLVLRKEGFRFSPEPSLPDPADLPSYGAPDPDWTVHGLDGSVLRLGDLRGRPVFVNIWATWCGPCVEEMPTIARLYASLQESGVAFLAVSEENRETVRKFVQQEKLSLPVYISETRLPAELETSGIPATFILDGAGRVVFKHIGVAEWDAAPVREFLLALRAQASAPPSAP